MAVSLIVLCADLEVQGLHLLNHPESQPSLLNDQAIFHMILLPPNDLRLVGRLECKTSIGIWSFGRLIFQTTFANLVVWNAKRQLEFGRLDV